MSEFEGGGCEATIGAINQIKIDSEGRLDYARTISQRMQSLRVRLVGHVPECVEKECENVPAPPSAEVEQLADTVNALQAVLMEIEENLSLLERL